VALERGTGEEWVMEERTASRARFENGRSTAQQRGKKTEGEGGSSRGSATRCGSGPSAACADDVCRARC
jgi:hypothetical protein